jgi:hypothetical protein
MRLVRTINPGKAGQGLSNLRRLQEEVGDLLAYIFFFRVTRRAIPQMESP